MSDGPIQIQRDNVDVFPQVPAEMPPWYTAPTPRRRSDWRALLVLCAFLFATVLAGGAIIWYIVTNPEPTPGEWVIRALLLLVAGIIIYSLALWLGGLARRAWLVQQPGGLVLTMPQVAKLDAQALVAQQLGVQHAYAAREFAHLSGSLTLTNSLPKAGEQHAALPAPQATISAVAVPEWLGWLDTQPHILLAAETGGGKSTTAKAILAPRIEAGEHVFIIDPHSSAWFGLPSVGGGENWQAVMAAMAAVLREYRQRLHTRDVHLQQTGKELPKEHFPRLTVLFDELNIARFSTDTAPRGEASPWELFTQVLGSGARKVHISIIGLCQSANVSDLGLSGAMRENFCRIALDSGAARKLITAEESDAKRREALYQALAGRDFPAVAEWRGQIYLLDRTGLDRVAEPTNPRRSIWPGWTANAAPIAPAEDKVLALLRRARAAGKSREATRLTLAQRGIQFENRLWTLAGTGLPSAGGDD